MGEGRRRGEWRDLSQLGWPRGRRLVAGQEERVEAPRVVRTWLLSIGVAITTLTGREAKLDHMLLQAEVRIRGGQVGHVEHVLRTEDGGIWHG